jgi:two-component system OmpR family sensor kinase
VTWPRHATIFWRTFLLSLTALVIADGVGLALSGAQSTPEGPPVNLGDVARWLSNNSATGVQTGPPGTMGMGPPGGGSAAPGVSGGPPGGFAGPPGPPPDLAPGGLQTPRRKWVLTDATRPPEAPADVDDTVSSRLTGLLAARLGVDQHHVRLYVKKAGLFDASGGSAVDEDELRLREGFIAGFERGGGQWKVLENRASGATELFQRRALWEFAVGVALLLPVSWMFARALSAPIRRFSEAAKRLGTDPYAPALERDGPAEMIVAIDSFNAMQGRVTRLLQERSQMVAAIAHDLRTPLTRLAFRLDGLDSPLRGKVESDIQQMTLMISATLDFVRDRSLGGTRERLDLRLLVESVVDDQRDVGHDVTIDGVESVPLQGDPVALRRACANLVDNAVKYGERARVHLRMLERNCVIDIDDDGPGIPEGLQERVFEPFFRAERSRNRDTGGIGLGLTTVRSIIVDHGGTVTLRNRKDGGLRVVVTLPVGAR